MNENFHLNTFEVKKKKNKMSFFFFESRKHLKIEEEHDGLANCVAAYFRKAGGGLRCEASPPTISGVLQDFKHSLCTPNPAVLHLSGNAAPGPKFHIPLRCASRVLHQPDMHAY